MLQPTSEQCLLIPQITWKLLRWSGVIQQWQMGIVNRSPNIDIFFGGLSGEFHPILSRSAARGQGAGIHLRNSDSAGGGGEGRGGEEMEGREAACQWACPVSLSTTQNSHLENQRLQPSGCLTHSLPPLNKNQADRTRPLHSLAFWKKPKSHVKLNLKRLNLLSFIEGVTVKEKGFWAALMKLILFHLHELQSNFYIHFLFDNDHSPHKTQILTQVLHFSEIGISNLRSSHFKSVMVPV